MTIDELARLGSTIKTIYNESHRTKVAQLILFGIKHAEAIGRLDANTVVDVAGAMRKKVWHPFLLDIQVI